jgi:hypothetical protein
MINLAGITHRHPEILSGTPVFLALAFLFDHSSITWKVVTLCRNSCVSSRL